MISTNYIGMRFGAFEVIEYYVIDNVITVKVICHSCKATRQAKIKYEKVLKLKCYTCGRFDAVIPISYYKGSIIVKDTINLGAYNYKKLKEGFKNEQNISEIEYLRNKIIQNSKGAVK